MGRPLESWHIPYIVKYQSPSPQEVLHVIFLQRLSDEERDQVLQNLRDVSKEWSSRLEDERPEPRTLVARKWIRDYWPSSDVILEIARHSRSTYHYDTQRYRDFIFVDSGWEAANVIAARWELNGEDEERLSAARVPMGIANLLLTTCNIRRTPTLAECLGDEEYEESKVDFYKDASHLTSEGGDDASTSYKWPSFLPEHLALTESEPTIISLRNLGESEVAAFLAEIVSNNEYSGRFKKIRLYNWQSSRHALRSDIYHIFQRMYNNTPNDDRSMCAFFVDNVLCGDNGEPQILAATRFGQDNNADSQIVPIQKERFLSFWHAAADGKAEERLADDGDIWQKENIYDMNTRLNFDNMDGCPVLFLQPFDMGSERKVRSALSNLNDIERNEDWGADYIYLGYLWPTGNLSHSVEDLRDLFESCEPFSTTYDPQRPGPYRFANYPHHFIAVDERALDPENPQVLLVSSLDFSGEETADQLGWMYGYVDAKDAQLNWVNLDIANVGPEECIGDEVKKLWLNDLNEYRENDLDSEAEL